MAEDKKGARCETPFQVESGVLLGVKKKKCGRRKKSVTAPGPEREGRAPKGRTLGAGRFPNLSEPNHHTNLNTLKAWEHKQPLMFLSHVTRHK